MAVALAFPPCLPLAPQSSHPLTQTRFNFFQRILTLNPTCALIYSACYFCPALACTVALIISSDSQGCMSLFQWEQTAKGTESLCQHHTIPHHILPKKTGAQKQGVRIGEKEDVTLSQLSLSFYLLSLMSSAVEQARVF